MRAVFTIFIFILILFTILSVAEAEFVALTSSADVSDNYIEFDVKEPNLDLVEVDFTLHGFQLEDVEYQGKNYKKIAIPGTGDLGVIGLPELPALSRFISMPPGKGAKIEILEVVTRDISGIDVVPLQGPVWEHIQQQPDFTIDEAFYNTSQTYPSQRVRIGAPVIMRDLRLLPVDFFPVSYNPVERTIQIIEKLKVKISFEGDGENPKNREFTGISSSFEPLYKSLVLNFTSRESGTEPMMKGGYLIISHPNLQDELQTFIDWKRQKGHYVEWVNLQVIGNSYSSIKNYIQEAYDTWEIPLEYVLLVGDVNGAYYLATEYYTGDVTDHKYSLLEGTDYFPDIQVGRISITSELQLMVILNKIINYERNPFMYDPEWLRRGLMVACTSQKSCKHTSQWIKQKMLDNGFASVDEIYYSGWVNTTLIDNSCNAGVAFFNYRGYNDWGGWNNGDIYAMQNGWKLPVVTGMVCDTGDFGDSECRAEAFLRTGTLGQPNGGVSACGPASLYTHTKWNNCIDMGFYAGLFDYGVTTAAGALNAGKMELWTNYPLNRGPGTTSNSVECYFHEYNTLGDPGLEIWTYIPDSITVDFNSELNLGAHAYPVNVNYTSTGEPVEEAYVCLLQGENILDWGYTDENGGLILYPDIFVETDISLTITKHNHIPFTSRLSVVQAPVYLDVVDFTIDDDNNGYSSGNDDGYIDPGETVELDVALSNFGENPADNILAHLSYQSSYIMGITNDCSYDNLSPGDSLFGNSQFVFTVSSFTPVGENLEFELEITNSTGTDNSVISLSTGGPELQIEEIITSPDADNFIPGDDVYIYVKLKNDGTVSSGILNSVLDVDHRWLNLQSSTAEFPVVAPGDTASNYSQPFIIETDDSMVPKTPFNFILRLENDSNLSQVLNFDVCFGRGSVTDPVGPDQYGYYAFGMEDDSYEACPQYQWLDISYSGTIIDLNEGSEQADLERIDLPFNFTFYGQDYDYAYVSSNGYITFDANPVLSFYNFAIPNPLGSDAMIAAFWDDLVVDYGEVRYNYNATHNVFVIAWNNVNIYYTGAINTFEIVLFDPQEYPTPTGDGMIQIQYQTFNNSHSSQNYCTIGIESHDGSDGIEYTFANLYDPMAQILMSNQAIKFTTLYPRTNHVPEIFMVNPQELSSVELNQTVTFAVDAFDLDNDELDYQWYHRGQPSGDEKACQLTFVEALQDTVTVEISDGVNMAQYEWVFSVEPASVDPQADEIPSRFKLGPVAPNPFNPVLNINFSIASNSDVKLSVYNVLGRGMAVLVDNQLEPGFYKTRWDASDFASGVYLIRLEAGEFSSVQKALLLK